ncbi:unnamed protein product [Timema podura]|uniref:DUF4485 domain-containing protein n=1 Tax=Timema podura TaxID=61482 RepID=A0ABN7NHP1_TIMPD|nr:unnamed protein product [Timema podura]
MKYRQLIQKWLDKLHELNKRYDTLNTSNDYIWFLLLVMQTNNLTEPFNKPPPDGELPPLNTIMVNYKEHITLSSHKPRNVYEDVLKKSDANSAWIDKVMSDKDAPEKSKNVEVAPPKFLANQPRPKNGTICYMAAFSNFS